MTKKFYFIISLIILIFSLFIYRVFDLATNKHEYYNNKFLAINEIYVEGASAPRGRILDVKGKVIVDNIGINSIFYHKQIDITLEEELEIAKILTELTNYKYKYNEKKLKDFYIIKNPDETNNLITEEEKELYSERKLTKEDLYDLKIKRITKEMLNKLTKIDKYSSYFYYLMNDGYMFDNKRLLENIDDKLYAKILESDLKGIFGEIEWKRKYNYGETLKSILGEISNNLPSEKKELLSKGYNLTDKVGISGLEEYYEEYLKGEKAIYKLDNNELKLEKNAKRGNDLVLEIDIDLQLKIEKIIKEEIKKAKKEPNTEHYRESYALISEPTTGNIKAIAGIRMLDNKTFQDVSINVIKNAYTVGSTVKAASMTVGYQNKAIDIGTSYTDSCVKLANLPPKCSYKSLGYLNDISALRESSNYYQFMIALNVAGYKYKYNMKADATKKDFDLYRNTFKEYGLGTLTGIDLPNESEGLKGEKIAIDLLLNFAIGQYDLYTPVSLLQYINTIGNNGERLKLNLMHSIKDGDKTLLKQDKKVLNKVNLDKKYMKRIQKGLREVIKAGTGYYYIDQSIPAAGKTGTSESYIDSNYDGTLDTFVLGNTFLMYAPFDKPKYSMVVISPNTSNLDGRSKYRSPVNRLIARNINDYLFTSK